MYFLWKQIVDKNSQAINHVKYTRNNKVVTEWLVKFSLMIWSSDVHFLPCLEKVAYSTACVKHKTTISNSLPVYFQGRFSAITYSLVGDDNAQVLFGIDSNQGFVFVTTNGLIADTASVYKVCTWWAGLLAASEHK